MLQKLSLVFYPPNIYLFSYLPSIEPLSDDIGGPGSISNVLHDPQLPPRQHSSVEALDCDGCIPDIQEPCPILYGVGGE